MTQHLFAAETAPSTADLDANFTELFALLLGTAALLAASGRVISPTGGLGYGTGAGGAVTQATSKSTPVTLNKVCGQITMNAATLAAGASVLFLLNNSVLAATDVLVCHSGSSTTYLVETANIGPGAANIRVTNVSGGALAEALIINFAVIKAVNV